MLQLPALPDTFKTAALALPDKVKNIVAHLTNIQDALTFLQHRPYKLRGLFLDVSPCFPTNGARLASETWCHAMARELLQFR